MILSSLCIRCHRLSFSSSVNFYISKFSLKQDHWLKKPKLVGMLCKWYPFFSKSEIHHRNKRVLCCCFMCRCVECLFYNQFLYIPYNIIFIENGDIFVWLLPISWYKGSKWSPPFKSFYFIFFKVLSLVIHHLIEN